MSISVGKHFDAAARPGFRYKPLSVNDYLAEARKKIESVFRNEKKGQAVLIAVDSAAEALCHASAIAGHGYSWRDIGYNEGGVAFHLVWAHAEFARELVEMAKDKTNQGRSALNYIAMAEEQLQEYARIKGEDEINWSLARLNDEEIRKLKEENEQWKAKQDEVDAKAGNRLELKNVAPV